MRSTSTVAGCLLAASLLLLTGSRPVRGQVFESLKCHKVVSAGGGAPLMGTLDVTALEPDFSAQGCRIIGRATELCAAVHVSGDQPPPTGPSFTSAALDHDYNCYRIVCNGVPSGHEVADGFGTAQEGFSRAHGGGPGSAHSTTLCVPAELSAPAVK